MKTKSSPARRTARAKLKRKVVGSGDLFGDKRPITRKIVRIGDGSPVGWSLYVEDYERAVETLAAVGISGAIYGEKAARKMWRKLMPETRESWLRSARLYLAAIGISSPNKSDQLTPAAGRRSTNSP